MSNEKSDVFVFFIKNLWIKNNHKTIILMGRKMLSHIIKIILNWLIPKKKNRIYVVPHINGKHDKYDILNPGSDNVLRVMDYIFENKLFRDYSFKVEYYDESRKAVLQHYKIEKQIDNCEFILAERDMLSQGKRDWHRIKNMLLRYSSRYWFVDTVYAGTDKVKRQKLLCFSYSTPFKKAVNTDDVRKHIDCLMETSLLTSMVHCSQYRVSLRSAPVLGFARNDTLVDSRKKDDVRKWISSMTSVSYDIVVFYAPTYRDYKGAYDDKNMFGYAGDTCELENLLEKENAIIIVKMHPRQDVGEKKFSNRILRYEENYQYSMYDFLSISDLLISDYSSVVHDFILTGKPVLHNLFDREQYESTRGFAFEPIDYICPGIIVENMNDLVKGISELLNKAERTDHYRMVVDMFHKYKDFNSTERIIDYLDSELMQKTL